MRVWYSLGMVSCFLLFFCVGCGGSSEAILPDGALTDEQVEEMKKEDAAVEAEESGGA